MILLDNAYYVTVPLVGTNLPEMTKVVYVVVDGRTVTMEYAAGILDDANARIQVWQDGALIQDAQVYDPAQDTDGSGSATAVQVGLNWSKVNKCLTNAGLSTWIAGTLVAACSLACALTAGLGCIGCLAAATGFGAGTIAGSIYASR